MRFNKFVILGLILVFAFSVNVALAEGQPEGTPFKAIWNAIAGLQQQITDIELLEGPKGDKGDTGDTGPAGSGLKIVDATDQEVGVLLDFQDPYSIPDLYTFEVWNSSLQKILLVSRSDGSVGSISISEFTFYTSIDCSTTPYKLFSGIIDPYVLYKVAPNDVNGLTWVNVLESTQQNRFMQSRIIKAGFSCQRKSIGFLFSVEVEAAPAPPTFVTPLSIVE